MDISIPAVLLILFYSQWTKTKNKQQMTTITKNSTQTNNKTKINKNQGIREQDTKPDKGTLQISAMHKGKQRRPNRRKKKSHRKFIQSYL